jgi:uncharacterized membrane protein
VFSRNVIGFFLVGALANIPALVILFVVQSVAPSRPGPDFDVALISMLIAFLAILVSFVFGMIANGAIAYGVVQDLRDGTVSIAQAIAIAARCFLPLIGVAISVGFLTGLGMAVVVPGIIAYCMYYVAAPVCIAEQAGVGASLSRSSVLTKGHRLQLFGAITLIVFVHAIASSAFDVLLACLLACLL